MQGLTPLRRAALDDGLGRSPDFGANLGERLFRVDSAVERPFQREDRTTVLGPNPALGQAGLTQARARLVSRHHSSDC